MELIVENAKYKSLEIAQDIAFSFDSILNEIEQYREDFVDKTQIINKLISFADKLMNEYLLFSENGELYHHSSNNFIFSPEFIKSGTRAIANNDLFGDLFFPEVDENNKYIYFYIPFKTRILENSIFDQRQLFSKSNDN